MSSNEIVRDNSTGLIWQRGEGGRMIWAKALDFCHQLTLAGFNDWRLPGKRELESSNKLQSRFPNLEKNHYWSSTSNNDYADYAWGLTIKNGTLFDDGHKTNIYYIRCVRGNKNLAEPISESKIEPRVEPQVEETSIDQPAEDNSIGWRFVVSPTYVSGMSRVVDVYKSNFKARGYQLEEDTSYPIGVSFNPYKQLEGGLRFGFGVGPLIVIMISGTYDSASFLAIPLNASVGYTTAAGAYLRAGLSMLNASGTFVESSSIGFVGAFGMEFNRKKRVSMGFELGIDTSEVELEKYQSCTGSSTESCISTTEKVSPIGLTASFLIVF